MLEVLPPGASKGKGVEILLAHLGIDPARLMALGEQASKKSAVWLERDACREGISQLIFP